MSKAGRPPNPPGTVVLNKERLAKEINELLGLKVPNHVNIRACKGYKIVSAVLKAMSKGIRKDGYLTVLGFGSFYLFPIKGHVGRRTLHHDWSKVKAQYIYTPPKTVVRFRPGDTLKALVNQGAPDVGDEDQPGSEG